MLYHWVYEAYILEVKSTAPKLILNIISCEPAGSDRWSCVGEQVTLPPTPPPTHNPPLNAVSHSDKGGIRSRSCHEGKGACTACTSFNSLYPEQTGRQRHRNLPTFEWLPTRWDAGNLYTQWSTRCFGEKGEQIVCTWWEEVLNVWHVADQNVLNIVFLWLTE